jgi:hypothetical protein
MRYIYAGVNNELLRGLAIGAAVYVWHARRELAKWTLSSVLMPLNYDHAHHPNIHTVGKECTSRMSQRARVQILRECMHSLEFNFSPKLTII